MKSMIDKFLLCLSFFFILYTVQAQTTATFDELSLDPDSYWNGVSEPLGTYFHSGNAAFYNYYDTAWGGLWLGGWAYSNQTDDETSGFANLYGTYAGEEFHKSGTFAVGTQASGIVLTNDALGGGVNSISITNTTFAALSMLQGDAFAKKFGGPDGTDPDWFKLKIQKWENGTLADDSVEVYLADYRFEDNSQDYVLKEWIHVDLTSLGNADSLEFTLSSSDVGQFGMNTPAFFCIDDLVTADETVSKHKIEANLNAEIFPTLTNGPIKIILGEESEKIHAQILDNQGKICLSFKSIDSNTELDISNLNVGIYQLIVYSAKNFTVKSITKI